MVIYYRITYGLQAIAALNVLIALLLPWHTATGSAFQLMQRPLEDFALPLSLFNVWWLMWLLPPVAVLSLIRGTMGAFERSFMPGRRTALITSGAALLSAAWFYINFWDEHNTTLVTTAGDLQIGYWLTVSSLMLLTLLILTEWLLPEQDPRLVRLARLAEDDPERIWEGHYRICTYCGSPNDPTRRRCIFCGMMILPEEQQPQEETPE